MGGQAQGGSREFMFGRTAVRWGITLFLGCLWSRLLPTTNECRWQLWGQGNLGSRFEQDNLLGWVQVDGLKTPLCFFQECVGLFGKCQGCLEAY